MGKKYLDTKEGSLEQSILGLWQEAAKNVNETNKNDKSDDGDGLDAVQPKAVKKKFKDRKDKDVDNDGDVDSSDKYLHKRRKAVSKAITKKEGNAFGMALKAAKDKGEKTFVVSGKTYEVKEEEVKEGKMSQLHQLIKDKKSAEEISKIMRLDLKSVKALMANYMSAGYNESYEIGTDKYRKHTEDVTPGEDGDWVAAQKGKNDSMRETLAKVWGFDEGKSPFKKESKKDLTKEVKDGKTMTGKKVASVDVNPKIMENLLELTEVAKSDLPSIYCDMDQVLVAFMKGADDAVGGDGFARMKDKNKRWELINQDKGFWANLDWMSGAKRLYDFIDRYDTYILSAYTSRDSNSIPGKMKWLKKNTKFKRSKINLVQRSQKQAYALSNGKPNVLIDDHLKNIGEWEAKGGIGIHHTNVGKTISELKKLGFK